MTTKIDSAEEFIATLHAMGDTKRIRNLTIQHENSAGDMVSFEPLNGMPMTGKDAHNNLQLAMEILRDTDRLIASISYSVDKVMIMNNDLDIAEEEYNVTGDDQRHVEKLMRGIAVNLNHEGYYLALGEETITWVA